MSLPRLLILGYSEASMLLRKPGHVDVRAHISIHGQREHPVEAPDVTHRLVLRFDDTEAPDESDPIRASQLRLRAIEAAQIGLNLTPPAVEHAEAIVRFAREVADCGGVLLCQCQAEVSRSSAAALICLAAWTEPGEEVECMRHVRKVRPCAVPNRDLVRFGDDLLGRGGKLLAALKE